MSNQFKPLKSGEVICVANPVQFVSPHNTFRVSEFAEAVKQELIKYSGYGVTEEDLGWLSAEGSECAVLKFGSPGWQKGKIRLKIEFCPDESVDPYTTFHHETVNNSNSQPPAPPKQQLKTESPPVPSYTPPSPEDDPFSSDPDLDFIAESATVLEFEQRKNFSSPSNNSTGENSPDDLEMLSQSLENELQAFSENSQSESDKDPFANIGNDDFNDDDNDVFANIGEDDNDDFADDDNDDFGFGELGLDDDDDNELSEDDSIWKDL